MVTSGRLFRHAPVSVSGQSYRVWYDLGCVHLLVNAVCCLHHPKLILCAVAHARAMQCTIYIQHPTEPKYRSLNMEKQAVKSRLGGPGALQMLRAAGNESMKLYVYISHAWFLITD